MKFNINKVKFVTLGGEPLKIKDIDKLLGDLIYQSINKLAFLPIAQGIYAGKEVELTEEERDTLVSFLSNDECGMMAFARQPIIEHLKQLKA